MAAPTISDAEVDDPVESAFRLTHIPALDGIRGIAILLTVAFHTDRLTGGYLGIDLFFVLSGFLISSLLLQEATDRGGIGLKHFWMRRARRLLPAALLVLLAAVAYSAFVEPAAGVGRTRAGVLSTLLYVANWNSIAEGASYWAETLTPSPVKHTWSLAVEEQFYLVWPLVLTAALALLRRRDLAGHPAVGWRRHGDTHPGAALSRVVMVLAPIGVLASTALMAALYEPGADPSRVYMGTDTRVAAILVGATLAAWMQVRGRARSTAGRAGLECAAIVALGLLAVAWLNVGGTSAWLYRGGFLAFSVAAAVVIATAVQGDRGPVSWLLERRWLCWFGAISYALYLWHWPVIVFLTDERTGMSGWMLTIVQVGVSVGVAAASTYLLELPIRERGFGALPGGLLIPVTAGVVALLLVTTVPFAEHPGAPTRDSSADLAAATASAGPRMLIVGDSLVLRAADELISTSATAGVAAVTEASGGCGIVAKGMDVGSKPKNVLRSDNICFGVPESWIARAEQLQPDVVLAMFASAANIDMRIDGTWVTPCEKPWQDRYRAEVKSLIDQLSAPGRRILWATVAPVTTGEPARPDAVERTACVNDAIRDVVTDAPDAEVVDLEGWLCPQDEACATEMDGVTLRGDGVHYQDESAQVLADWVIPEVVEAADLTPTTTTTPR